MKYLQLRLVLIDAYPLDGVWVEVVVQATVLSQAEPAVITKNPTGRITAPADFTQLRQQ